MKAKRHTVSATLQAVLPSSTLIHSSRMRHDLPGIASLTSAATQEAHGSVAIATRPQHHKITPDDRTAVTRAAPANAPARRGVDHTAERHQATAIQPHWRAGADLRLGRLLHTDEARSRMVTMSQRPLTA